MNNYGLPPTYQSRMQPDYFADVLPDSELWQADVYRLAAWLARKAGARVVVDIGCGRGKKLLRLGAEFAIIGIDHGDNILENSRLDFGGMTLWLDRNLEKEVIEESMFMESVTVCADVIEHIPDLTALIETLRNASKTAAYVLLSTPDRERLNQGTPNGMPANKAHVREWTRREFTDWLKSEELPVIWSGWTVSYDKQRDKRNTILVVLSNDRIIDDMPTAFEEAK